MTFALSIPKVSAGNILPASLIATVLIGGAFCFPSSYLLHTNVIVGALLFPFTFFVTGSRRNNYFLLAAVLLSGAFALGFSVRIGYFLALLLFVIWIVECFVGSCNVLVLFQLLFMSPIFTQVTMVLGFALRLKISAIAGAILRWGGMNVVVEGNLINLDGAAFSVDDACVGLNMLSIAMLISSFILSYRYRISGKTLSPPGVAVFFFIVFVLVVATNLSRILILVSFHIPPEDVMHEIIGLLCLVFYTIVPLYFISAWFITRGRTITIGPTNHAPLTNARIALPIAMTLLMLLGGVAMSAQRRAIDQSPPKELSLAPTTVMLNDGVAKITTDRLLIYVKPIDEWFTSEHTPLICWKGSGYNFAGVREVVVSGQTIYCGRLVKDGEQLSTAWWYCNGRTRTISQLEWRREMMLEGAEYCLVNVTASDEQTLMDEIASIFKEGKDTMLTKTKGNLQANR